MSRDIITWSLDIQPQNLNERVPLLHFMWPNHAKVIKIIVPKLTLMKDTPPYRTGDLWLNDILANEERKITAFTKTLRY